MRREPCHRCCAKPPPSTMPSRPPCSRSQRRHPGWDGMGRARCGLIGGGGVGADRPGSRRGGRRPAGYDPVVACRRCCFRRVGPARLGRGCRGCAGHGLATRGTSPCWRSPKRMIELRATASVDVGSPRFVGAIAGGARNGDSRVVWKGPSRAVASSPTSGKPIAGAGKTSTTWKGCLRAFHGGMASPCEVWERVSRNGPRVIRREEIACAAPVN